MRACMMWRVTLQRESESNYTTSLCCVLPTELSVFPTNSWKMPRMAWTPLTATKWQRRMWIQFWIANHFANQVAYQSSVHANILNILINIQNNHTYNDPPVHSRHTLVGMSHSYLDCWTTLLGKLSSFYFFWLMFTQIVCSRNTVFGRSIFHSSFNWWSGLLIHTNWHCLKISVLIQFLFECGVRQVSTTRPFKISYHDAARQSNIWYGLNNEGVTSL